MERKERKKMRVAGMLRCGFLWMNRKKRMRGGLPFRFLLGCYRVEGENRVFRVFGVGEG